MTKLSRTAQAFTTTMAYIVVVLAAMLMMLCAFGCSSPAQRVLLSVNCYEFHMARYEETCPGPTVATEAPKDWPLSGLSYSTSEPMDCPTRAAILRKWSEALDESGAALKRGGKFPLQLERLKTVEQGYPK